MKKGTTRNAPQSRLSARSICNYDRDSHKLRNISTAMSNKLINGSSGFRTEDRGRFQTFSLREMNKPEAGPTKRKPSLSSSMTFDIDKPSIVRSFTFDSLSKQGNGYQLYSSNLVRQNNAKKEMQDYKEKKKLEASIRRWNRKVDNTLEDSQKKVVAEEKEEEEEEFQYSEAPDITSLTMHGSTSHMRLFNKTFANVQAPKYDPVKEKQLAQLVKSKLKRGKTVAQMALEPVFENVLDVCCDKSYFSSVDKPDTELSLDDWRALRKCKYLRISQRNIASLKEATLDALKDK